VRAVIDTNVLVSALLWNGPPHALMANVREGLLEIAISPVLLAELSTVIGRSKFNAILVRAESTREQILTEIRKLAEVIEPPPLPQPVCRDPDDDAVLALAIAAQVDWIISGDDDLLSLRSYAGIAIISPVEALAKLVALDAN